MSKTKMTNSYSFNVVSLTAVAHLCLSYLFSTALVSAMMSNAWPELATSKYEKLKQQPVNHYNYVREC